MSLSIRLPAEIEARLQALATATGRTKSYYITEAICKHLEDLEEYHLAEQRGGERRAGRSEPHSLEEVMHRYGMES